MSDEVDAAVDYWFDVRRDVRWGAGAESGVSAGGASKARCKPEQLLCADAGFIAGAAGCVHDDCRHAGAEGDGVRPRAAEHQPGVADCGAADGKAAGWPDGATGQDGRATDGCRAERDSGHPRGGDVEGRADAWGRRRSEAVWGLAPVD